MWTKILQLLGISVQKSGRALSKSHDTLFPKEEEGALFNLWDGKE